MLTRWFPVDSRGLPQGLLNTTALIGAAAAPFAAERIMEFFDGRLGLFFLEHFGSSPIGWRWTFLLFGLLGVVWGAAFWRKYRDDPSTHPRVNAAELTFIRQGRDSEEMDGPPTPLPWGAAIASRNMWLMGLIMSCVSFAAYFYLFWYPSYLQKGRGISPAESGTLSSLVLAGGALGSACGGLLSDYVSRRSGGNRRASVGDRNDLHEPRRHCPIRFHRRGRRARIVLVGFVGLLFHDAANGVVVGRGQRHQRPARRGAFRGHE